MRNRYFFFLWALSVGLVLLCFVKLYNSQPVIVFMGGGSVKSFIDEKYVKIDDFPRSFYLNLPSSNSWLPLVEEIERARGNDTIRTTIISLSADTMNIENLKQHKQIFEANRIIGIHLGYDPLCLYTQRPGYIKIDCNLKSITSCKLNSVINSTSSKYLYTTKDSSGTYKAYKSILDSILDRKVDKKNIFYDFYNKEDFEQFNDSFVFLGSKYYKPKLDGLKSFYITDTLSQVATKPICIYFATYKNKMGVYSLSAPVVDFLRYFKDSIDTTVWEMIERRGNWLDEAKKLKHNKNHLGIIYLNSDNDKLWNSSKSTRK